MRKLIIGIATAVIVLSACGGTKDASLKKGDDVRAAVARTTAQKSGKVELTSTSSGLDDPHSDGTDVSTGVVRYDIKAFHLTQTTNQTNDNPGTGESIFVDGNLYLRADPATTATKPWSMMDVPGLAGQQLRSAQNPFDGLAVFKTSESPSKVGSEEIRGVKTTHYRVQVDPKKLSESSDEAERNQADQLLTVYPEVPFAAELWVDKNQLVRRISMSFDASTIKMGIGAKGEHDSLTFDFYDFGTSVSIDRPAPDQTQLFSDVYP